MNSTHLDIHFSEIVLWILELQTLISGIYP